MKEKVESVKVHTVAEGQRPGGTTQCCADVRLVSVRSHLLTRGERSGVWSGPYRVALTRVAYDLTLGLKQADTHADERGALTVSL